MLFDQVVVLVEVQVVDQVVEDQVLEEVVLEEVVQADDKYLILLLLIDDIQFICT